MMIGLTIAYVLIVVVVAWLLALKKAAKPRAVKMLAHAIIAVCWPVMLVLFVVTTLLVYAGWISYDDLERRANRKEE